MAEERSLGRRVALQVLPPEPTAGRIAESHAALGQLGNGALTSSALPVKVAGQP